MVNGEKLSNYLVNQWGQSNQPMRDIDSPADTISIKPQDKTFTIEINSYFSTNAKIKEDDLIDNNYRSSQVNILGTQRPPKPPAGFPDYSTFLVGINLTFVMLSVSDHPLTIAFHRGLPSRAAHSRCPRVR